MSEILYPEESYALTGAAFEVYKELGCGYLEPVYQEAYETELRLRRVPFESQKGLTINYKGKPLTKSYIADILGYGKIIVELKAEKQLSSRHEAQVLNYLKATSFRLGLLYNFGAEHRLEWKRIVR